MRDDEFTNSKSNNESFIAKSEFGNLPDSEFSDSGEMHMHKAAYDPSLMKSNSNSGNTKTVEDVTQSSSTAVESTVAGSGAATSIAATSAGETAAYRRFRNINGHIAPYLLTSEKMFFIKSKIT